jgi:acetate---CoA ligase (ADP-forming)
MLRTHRRLQYSVAVSSGQELVTSMADYLHYALDLDETRVVGLFAETLRDVDAFRAGLSKAAERDIPVVTLTVGSSPKGRSFVAAHSGAIAGDRAAWEALFSAYGVHHAESLDELVDTLEMFAVGRRVPRGSAGGLATVHDSGGERALIADRSAALGVPFADLSTATQERLAAVLDPGLPPTNPLDVWGRGSDTEALFGSALLALADDPAVAVVAAGIDLVEEYDGDQSYPRAIETVLGRTTKPLLVLGNVAASLDQRQASHLRQLGVPVLEGTESGLRAVRHLLDHAAPTPPRPAGHVEDRRAAGWRTTLAARDLDAMQGLALLRDYDLTTVTCLGVESRDEAIAAAARLGFPAVLKTDAPGCIHKTDVDGVRVGLLDESAVGEAYDDISRRLGPRVVVQELAPPGVELALGVVRDPLLGPLVVVAAGGALVEVVRQRRVLLPPVTALQVADELEQLPALSAILDGARGRPPVNREAVVRAVVGVGQLAWELGDSVEELDVNPLICNADAAVAVDSLVVRR